MARERSKNREETRSVKSLRLHTWRDSSLFIFHADTRTNPHACTRKCALSARGL